MYTYNPDLDDDFDPRDEPDYDEDWDGSRLEFADPGGNSALRAASKTNPRNLPCPTCGRENMLTPKDVALHYQCDYCADALEGGFGGEY